MMTTSASYTTDANGNRISPSTSNSPVGELSPSTTETEPTVWRYDFDNSDSDCEDDDDDGQSTPHIASSGDESSDFGEKTTIYQSLMDIPYCMSHHVSYLCLVGRNLWNRCCLESIFEYFYGDIMDTAWKTTSLTELLYLDTVMSCNTPDRTLRPHHTSHFHLIQYPFNLFIHF
jgi:hypothetical protein